MKQDFRILLAAVAPLLLASSAGQPAFAQKQGGTLRMSHFDSPASMSLHEEATAAANRPMMGVFNNLVMYKQDVPQNSMQSIVPDLAVSWSWSEEGTELTFPLRQGVKWHDGKPFTAHDVKCTWDMLTGMSDNKLRLNPRKSWYRNLEEVSINGDYEVTFRLKRPQPSFLALLASGWSPIYPCHVAARDMRTRPIGTGPFKFVEFKPNELIRVIRNPDYWKHGRPYLDGIEYRIIPNLATRILGFVSDKFDTVTGVTVPLLKDVKSQSPQAVCEVVPTNVPRTLLINPAAPPFDNRDLRRAMALSLDRKAFIDIITEGLGDIGGVMLPAPEGVWGMPPDMLKSLPGYDPDVAKNRAEARKIMEGLGYGPDKRIAVKVSIGNIAPTRDPAVIPQVHLTSLAVNGLPSCHLMPWRSGKVSSVPSSLHDQLTARSGTIDCIVFCGASCLYITRLLKTPIIGRLAAAVASSCNDMLAGLSKCDIFNTPPCFWANAVSPASIPSNNPTEANAT